MRHLFANRKKLIVGIIVGVMAIVIFAWRYIAVNKACPPAQVEQYSLGDTVLHNGVEYTLTDYKVLSQDEFCDEYEIDPIHVKASGQESKIIVFTMYAKNVSDHNVNVDFAGQMLLQMGDYLCSYKYKVQIFVSSGNLNQPPFREWPPQGNMGDRDRIISPADSVRAITVGAIALKDSDNSIVKRDEPAPFSRRGPGANYIVKPDVVDYGGNITRSSDFTGIGIKGLDNSGNIIESVGTSYSTPRVVQKFATVYDTMVERDLLLAKAITIHSARMNFRDSLDRNPNNIKYYGFGMPSTNTQDILQCSSDEITLVFRQKIMQGTHLEMVDFPYPKSLIHDGKCFGEIGMTLAYDPILDACYGREYCRTNIDASFGMCYTSKAGMQEFRGCVPLETTWDEKYEKSRVENGFKWSPIKSYYRKISSKGIKAGENWKIRINLTPRNGLVVTAQEFVLIITIRDAQGHDIYSEVVNGLRERGYITNNLETRQQIRQRQ